jgi:hypothetical protein
MDDGNGTFITTDCEIFFMVGLLPLAFPKINPLARSVCIHHQTNFVDALVRLIESFIMRSG